MDQNDFTQILKWIIKIGVLSIVFTPFFVYQGFFFPYIFTKTIIFRILVEIILFAYLMLIAVDVKSRFKSSPISRAIFIYAGAILAASAIGMNFTRSLWSTTGRNEGIITILHLIAFFVIVLSIFKEKKDWRLLFNTVFAVGILQSGYSLLQKAGVEGVLSNEGRIHGTIGNASFFASFILLTIFISAILLWEKKDKIWRIGYAIGILFMIYVLYHTQTRGAILGLLGGGVIFALLCAFFSNNKRLKRGVAAGLILLTLAASGIWICRKQAWVKNSPTLSKFTAISSLDASTSARFMVWGSALKGWTESLKTFLFGYGYENFNIPANKYFNPKLLQDEGSQVWFDRAHNIILDIALTSGLMGLIAYFVIFAAILWGICLKIKEKENLYLYFLLIGGLSAYFIQNLFVFDTLPVYILLYIVLAYVVFVTQKEKTEKEQLKKININSFGTVLIAAFFCFLAYYLNVQPALANHSLAIGFKHIATANECNSYFEEIGKNTDRLLTEGGKTKQEIDASRKHYQDLAKEHYEAGINSIKKAIAYNTYQNVEFREHLAESLLNFYEVESLPDYKASEYFDYAIAELEKSIGENRYDVQIYAYTMLVYNISAQYDFNRVQKALDIGNKAIALSPTRQEIYSEMAKLKIGMKEYEESIPYFQKAIDLNPKTIASHWNLALAYVKMGNIDKAKEKVRDMENLGILANSPERISRWIKMYKNINEMQRVAELYDELLYFSSFLIQKPEYFLEAAEANKEIGEIEKAKNYAQVAGAMDPSLSSRVDEFLKEL